MKLKPKEQELEQLVEEQDAEAVMEEEALAQEQKAESPYRVTEDLSYKLNLPREVKGLVELMELDGEKKRLLRLERESRCGYNSLGPLSSIGGFTGMIPGIILMLYNLAPQGSYLGSLEGMALFFGGVMGGAFAGTKIGEKRHYSSQKYKDFERQKAAKMQELEEQIKLVGQKLFHYQTNYRTGDMVLAEYDNRIFIGDVYTEQEGKAVLYKSSLGDPKRLVEVNTAVYVLTPAAKLSIDDLYSLDSKTPIIYDEGEQGRQEYGFVEKREKDFLITNSPRMGLKKDHEIKKAYPLHLLESIMINPRILVPELKPRIRL